MKNRRFGFSVAFLSLAAVLAGAWNVDEIRAALTNRTGEARKALGIVVGLVDDKGGTVVAAGRTALGGAAEPDARTVFEIGSITKVFTSLVLADMIERGEVKPDDPVAKYLPAGVRVPARGGREITLLDLSMQVSGLPRLPNNLKPADPLNPYADYGPAKLYEFLSGHALVRDIGASYEYSNLGVGLLGHALALRAGMGYEELVRRRVLEPLGMTDTSVSLTGSQRLRLAAGTTAALTPAKNWDLDALAGAGALRSTAEDMMKFLTAAMGSRETPLGPAFRRMLSVRRATGTPDLDIAMGWHIWKKFGTEIVWHNGGTGGYRSFAGFLPDKTKAVVVLTNTSFGVDDLGLHTLESQYPVAHFSAPRERKETAVDARILEKYAGEYELAPGAILVLTSSGGRLFMRAPGQPQFELFAESPTEFFRKGADIQIVFVADGPGAVTHLVLKQNGFDRKAPKIK